MRVFVLSTGRCGSTTFARACDHLTNFTAGHETRSQLVGKARLDYSDRHIEVDNRLSWMLGGLNTTFDPEYTFYVHLTRDPDAVADSYLRRWDNNFRANMIRAFAHGIVTRSKDWSDEERFDVARFYVDTVNQNIGEFLRDKPHVAHCGLDTIERDFADVLSRIGADGDIAAALAEWSYRHNASDT